MSSLVEKLDALSLKDESDRKDLYGYIYRTKKDKTYFFCDNDFLVILDCENKKMILCKLIRHAAGNCYLCFECENSSVFENMDLENYAKTKPCDCIHINLCKVIFTDIPSKNKTPHTALNSSRCTSWYHGLYQAW